MDTGTEVVRQERQDSGVTRPAIKHNDDTDFIVNILSLHNYKMIRQLIDDRFECFTALHSPTTYPSIRQQAVASLDEKERRKGKQRQVTEPSSGTGNRE